MALIDSVWSPLEAYVQDHFSAQFKDALTVCALKMNGLENAVSVMNVPSICTCDGACGRGCKCIYECAGDWHVIVRESARRTLVVMYMPVYVVCLLILVWVCSRV